MTDELKISGKIISGSGQGAFFTQLDWVRSQCLNKLGFAPWPGTLNLQIAADCVDEIEDLKVKSGLELISPDSKFCSGYLLPISIKSIPAAIVFPADDVRVHSKDIIEIIAPEMLKDALNVEDGDLVYVKIVRAMKKSK